MTIHSQIVTRYMVLRSALVINNRCRLKLKRSRVRLLFRALSKRHLASSINHGLSHVRDPKPVISSLCSLEVEPRQWFSTEILGALPPQWVVRISRSFSSPPRLSRSARRQDRDDRRCGRRRRRRGGRRRRRCRDGRQLRCRWWCRRVVRRRRRSRCRRRRWPVDRRCLTLNLGRDVAVLRGIPVGTILADGPAAMRHAWRAHRRWLVRRAFRDVRRRGGHHRVPATLHHTMHPDRAASGVSEDDHPATGVPGGSTTNRGTRFGHSRVAPARRHGVDGNDVRVVPQHLPLGVCLLGLGRVASTFLHDTAFNDLGGGPVGVRFAER